MESQLSFPHVFKASFLGALWFSEALIIRLLFYIETSDQSYAAWHVWYNYDLCIAKKNSKSNFDQSDVIQWRNPHTSVKLLDNLMSCVLRWSKSLYFCVIMKEPAQWHFGKKQKYIRASRVIAFWISEKLKAQRSGKTTRVNFKIVFTTSLHGVLQQDIFSLKYKVMLLFPFASIFLSRLWKSGILNGQNRLDVHVPAISRSSLVLRKTRLTVTSFLKCYKLLNLPTSTCNLVATRRDFNKSWLLAKK